MFGGWMGHRRGAVIASMIVNVLWSALALALLVWLLFNLRVSGSLA
jgi:hypothetical protein